MNGCFFSPWAGKVLMIGFNALARVTAVTAVTALSITFIKNTYN